MIIHRRKCRQGPNTEGVRIETMASKKGSGEVLWKMSGNFCLSSAIHRMGQNIKSLSACVCVCTRVLEAEYVKNGQR